MAKTLTIASEDFLPQYVTNSVNIKELIQNKSNTMTLSIAVKTGQDVPLQGSEIVYKDDTRFLFGGYITRTQPIEYGEGSFFMYEVEASDYAWIFNNKIARKAYSNQTLKAIVEDLLSTYLDSDYMFTTTNVQTGPIIPTITFDHISLRKCFEKLSKLTGYVWGVDYEKNMFFQSKIEDPAPESFTDSSNNFESIAISYDTTQVRNSVIVIGSSDGQQGASTNTQTFVGDGETRSWELEDKPSQVVSVKVNGVTQQFSLDLNERETDNYVYSFTGQSIRQTTNETTLTGGQTLEIVYYPRVPIIVQQRDPESIAFFSALDGGDGIYEYTLKEDSITSKSEAIERAEQELDEFADPLVNAIVRTRSGLLSSPSNVFKAGQYITVNLPSWGISTDTTFLIQEVIVKVIESASETQYQYTIRFGGRIVDVEKFIESLASEGSEVQDVEEIKTIFGSADENLLGDYALARTLNTPPFEYGPSGSPQGKWNLSEWA